MTKNAIRNQRLESWPLKIGDKVGWLSKSVGWNTTHSKKRSMYIGYIYLHEWLIYMVNLRQIYQTRWFKSWPFDPRSLDFHQQPLKESRFSPSPKKVRKDLPGTWILWKYRLNINKPLDVRIPEVPPTRILLPIASMGLVYLPTFTIQINQM